MDPNTVVGKEIAEFLSQFGYPYPPRGGGTASNVPVDMSNAGILARLTDRSLRVINQAHKDTEKLNQSLVYSDVLLQAIAREQGSVAHLALQNLDLLDPILAHKPTSGPARVPGPLPLFRDVKNALEKAGAIATSLGHPYIGVEHILLGLLEQPDSTALGIMATHVKKEIIRAEVLDLLGCFDPNIPRKQKEPVVKQPITLGVFVQHRTHAQLRGTVTEITTQLYGPPKAGIEGISPDGRLQQMSDYLEAFEITTKKEGE